MNLSRDQIGGLFMLCFSGVYSFLILDIPTIETASSFDARSLPIFLAILGLVFSLSLLIRHGETATFSNLNFRLGLAFIVLLLVYGLSLRPIGFLFSTLVFLFVGFWLLGERSIPKNLIVAAAVSAGFWLIMSELLGVYLPPLPELLSA